MYLISAWSFLYISRMTLLYYIVDYSCYLLTVSWQCNFLYLQTLSPAEKSRLKQEFMREFDENRDGKIEMSEVSKLISYSVYTWVGNVSILLLEFVK